MIVEKNSSINNSLGISSICKYLVLLESENDFDDLKDFLTLADTGSLCRSTYALSFKYIYLAHEEA